MKLGPITMNLDIAVDTNFKLLFNKYERMYLSLKDDLMGTVEDSSVAWGLCFRELSGCTFAVTGDILDKLKFSVDSTGEFYIKDKWIKFDGKWDLTLPEYVAMKEDLYTNLPRKDAKFILYTIERFVEDDNKKKYR